MVWCEKYNIAQGLEKIKAEETKIKKKDENDDEPTTDHSEIVSAVNCVSNTELSALSVEEIDGWIDIDKNVPIKEDWRCDITKCF